MHSPSPAHLRTFRRAALLDSLAWAVPRILYPVAGAVLLAKGLGQWSPWAGSFQLIVPPAAFVAAALAAVLHARRTPCDDMFVRAWLDWRNHAGGRILAHGPDPAARLAVTPALSPMPVAKAMALPAAFLLAVALVPERVEANAGAAQGVQRKIAVVEHAIHSAETQRAIPPATAANLHERLRSVEQTAARRPEGAAEAADAVRKQLEDAVLARVEASLQSLEKAMRARESLAARATDPAASRQALRDLADALDAVARAEGGAERLPEDLAQALRELAQQAGAADLADFANAGDLARMNPADLKKLIETLREMAKRNGECAGACTLGPGTRQALLSMMEGMPRLSGQPMDGEGGDPMEGEGPGNGGVSRGRGDAPLSFGEESDAAGARFAPKALAPGQGFIPGVRVGVERQAMPDEAVPPQEFRGVQRTGVGVDGAVYAGESGTPLGPDRAEAADRYFETLSKNPPRP